MAHGNHTFHNPIADDPTFTGTKPSDWNASIPVTLDGNENYVTDAELIEVGTIALKLSDAAGSIAQDGNQYARKDGGWAVVIAPSSGDVVGPGIAVDSNFASFNTTTGKLIKDSTKNASSFEAALTSATSDASPVDTDEVISLRSSTLRTTWANIKIFLASKFVTNGGSTARITTSGIEPTSPAPAAGDIWIDTATAGAVSDVGKLIKVLAQSAVASSVTNSTVETTLATYVLPAGIMGLNGAVRISYIMTYTGSTNVKSLRPKFGGTAVFTSSRNGATQTLDSLQFTLTNRGNASSQITTPTFATGGALTPITMAINTANAVTITITGQCAALAETITLEAYTIELLPGAN